MAKRKARKKWMDCRTYAELRAFADGDRRARSPEENWGIMERMRQLRYGYKPGELKMDKTAIKVYTLKEFRGVTEREYREEIKKFGPR